MPLLETDPNPFLATLLSRGESKHLAIEMGVDYSYLRAQMNPPPNGSDDCATGKKSGLHRLCEMIEAMGRLGWNDKIVALLQYVQAHAQESMHGSSALRSLDYERFDPKAAARALEDEVRAAARCLEDGSSAQAVVHLEELQKLVDETLAEARASRAIYTQSVRIETRAVN